MDAPDLTADVINVTSGLLRAKLHRARFICPGINRECIEYDGQFISPKSFYIMADKGSLKDWKNAIRINGKKIRRYIDSGELDFFNHNELCTGRCKSKMGNKNSTLNDTLNEALMSSPPHSLRKNRGSTMGSSCFDNDNYSSNDSLNIVKDVDSYGDAPDVKPDLEQLRMLNLLNLQQTDDVSFKKDLEQLQLLNVVNRGHDRDEASLSGDQAVPLQIVQITRSIQDENDEDTMFWRAIVQLGLVDEFFREIKAKLDVLKANMIKNYVPTGDAKKASRIVNELGMRSKLDMRLCAHKFEFDRQRDKIEKEMEQLKRKMSEYEQKNEILKQKSDTYQILMSKKLKLEDMSTSEMQPRSKAMSQEINQILVQSPVSMLVSKAATQSKETSPNVEEKSSVRKSRKRARIEEISQGLSQFAVQNANTVTVVTNGDHESNTENVGSRSESPNPSQDSSAATASQESGSSSSASQGSNSNPTSSQGSNSNPTASQGSNSNTAASQEIVAGAESSST